MSQLRLYLNYIRPFTLLAPAVGLISGALMPYGMMDLKVIPAVFSAVLLNAASNSINQIFDLEIDKINKPHRPLPSGSISLFGASIYSIFLYVAVISLAYTINKGFFMIILGAAFITVLYSAPPFRLKRFPFLSNIAIALARGMLLIVAGWSVYDTPYNSTPWFLGLIFAFYLLGAASTKDFSDIEGDTAFGVRTLPSVYGVEKSLKIIAPFFIFPFLLIPLGVFSGLIPHVTMPLVLLSLWGAYAYKLLSNHPSELTLETNHLSWKHMYLILITGQAGLGAMAVIAGGFL